jgi:hypothetical protein
VYTSDGGFNAGMVTFENDQGLSLVRISVPSELILTLSLSAIENRCLEATTRLRAAARCSVLAGMELIVEPHGTLDETVLTELKGPTLAAIAVVPTALTPTLPREFLVRSAPYGLAMLRHIHAAERLHLA